MPVPLTQHFLDDRLRGAVGVAKLGQCALRADVVRVARLVGSATRSARIVFRDRDLLRILEQRKQERTREALDPLVVDAAGCACASERIRARRGQWHDDEMGRYRTGPQGKDRVLPRLYAGCILPFQRGTGLHENDLAIHGHDRRAQKAFQKTRLIAQDRREQRAVRQSSFG